MINDEKKNCQHYHFHFFFAKYPRFFLKLKKTYLSEIHYSETEIINNKEHKHIYF